MKRTIVVEKDFTGKRHFEAKHVRAMSFPVAKLFRFYRELDASAPCLSWSLTFIIVCYIVPASLCMLLIYLIVSLHSFKCLKQVILVKGVAISPTVGERG